MLANPKNHKRELDVERQLSKHGDGENNDGDDDVVDKSHGVWADVQGEGARSEN
jgi:hypothetical protein